MSATVINLEGKAGVGSDIVGEIVEAVGQPSLMVFTENRGYYAEFDTESFSAHVCSKQETEDSWSAVVSWLVRSDGPAPTKLIEYLESVS